MKNFFALAVPFVFIACSSKEARLASTGAEISERCSLLETLHAQPLTFGVPEQMLASANEKTWNKLGLTLVSSSHTITSASCVDGAFKLQEESLLLLRDNATGADLKQSTITDYVFRIAEGKVGYQSTVHDRDGTTRKTEGEHSIAFDVAEGSYSIIVDHLDSRPEPKSCGSAGMTTDPCKVQGLRKTKRNLESGLIEELSGARGERQRSDGSWEVILDFPANTVSAIEVRPR